jgi:putative transport protein
VTFLVDHPILLLFLVAGVGSVVGRVQLGAFSLGSAAVLFCGLAASAIDDRLVLGEDLQTFGLALFTYTVGVATGPAFAAGLRGRGLRSLATMAAVVAVGVVAALGLADLAGLRSGTAGGLFAGALTNTPALGAVLDHAGAGDGARATVAYSLTYPGGVVGALVAAHLALRRHGAATTPAGTIEGASPALVAWTVLVERPGLPALGELRSFDGGVAFGHHDRDGHVGLATADIVPRPGDLVTVVGPEARVAAFAAEVGRRSDRHLTLENRSFDIQRFAISSPALAGRTLGELQLPERYGVLATRVRRSDIDMVADDDLVLELGDRVRIIAPEEQLHRVAELFGDSESRLAEVDFAVAAFGLAAGIALGAASLPGGFSLGAGGGALVAGLVLGAIGRVGPILLTTTHQAALTLRQLGMVVFLAAVGTRSGEAFASSAFSWSGARTVGLGLVVTSLAMTVALLAGRRWCAFEGPALAGAVAGAQTQPAVLAFTEQRAPADPAVPVGYTSVYPAAMLLKILAAQLFRS